MMNKYITTRKYLEDDLHQFGDYCKIKKTMEII